jgi:hypothetical protein
MRVIAEGPWGLFKRELPKLPVSRVEVYQAKWSSDSLDYERVLAIDDMATVEQLLHTIVEDTVINDCDRQWTEIIRADASLLPEYVVDFRSQILDRQGLRIRVSGDNLLFPAPGGGEMAGSNAKFVARVRSLREFGVQHTE